MPQSITTFLMFEGRAEEAMRFYMSLFPNSEMVQMSKYGPQGPGPEGSVIHAIFTLNGRQVMASDSYVKHAFTFTPSTSFFVQCEDAAEFERLYAALSEGGLDLMPPNNYGFSQQFGWCNDRFGVSWQINLP
ncbi:VOC family protein [Hyphomicrobium sp. CS1BSMeth3]|uniref:VOC family protein n=1 Tax=Hyphomicrobium sp. CS1BSMeth3 TaxID=1892844 RepID=UPI0009309B92|nr:VOC family protein [Hyphomicrobium sp. CS1BSMeth3]